MNWARLWDRTVDLAPAIVVGVAAVAATAHGGYEVAVASRVPEGLIATLYPVITDGLALVAYAATRRLRGAGLVYAWSVVIAAAGLSGIAQAVFLASDMLTTSPALRFGVGAWPAVAGAVAAHLVFLLAHRDPPAVEDPAAVEVAELVVTPAVEVAAQPEPVEAERPKLHSVPAAKRVVMVKAAATPDVDTDKVAKLVANGAGRGTLMKELGITAHQARTLAKKVKP